MEATQSTCAGEATSILVKRLSIEITTKVHGVKYRRYETNSVRRARRLRRLPCGLLGTQRFGRLHGWADSSGSRVDRKQSHGRAGAKAARWLDTPRLSCPTRVLREFWCRRSLALPRTRGSMDLNLDAARASARMERVGDMALEPRWSRAKGPLATVISGIEEWAILWVVLRFRLSEGRQGSNGRSTHLRSSPWHLEWELQVTPPSPGWPSACEWDPCWTVLHDGSGALCVARWEHLLLPGQVPVSLLFTRDSLGRVASRVVPLRGMVWVTRRPSLPRGSVHVEEQEPS